MTRTQSFTVVLLIELWERFGYYGMQAILLLFMVQQLGFSDARSNLLWGAFGALTYAAPAIGGWIGDKVLGSRRTMLLGAITLAVGYLLMSLPVAGTGLLYAAMGTITVGNGLFKSNAANMVRRIYEGDDSRLDGAFTIYYMAVNVGSTVSILLCPWLKDRFGWHVAFGMCCAGLVVGSGELRHHASAGRPCRLDAGQPPAAPDASGRRGRQAPWWRSSWSASCCSMRRSPAPACGWPASPSRRSGSGPSSAVPPTSVPAC